MHAILIGIGVVFIVSLILSGYLWPVLIGGFIGSFIGVAGFGGAIAGTIPGAIIGAIVAIALTKKES